MTRNGEADPATGHVVSERLEAVRDIFDGLAATYDDLINQILGHHREHAGQGPALYRLGGDACYWLTWHHLGPVEEHHLMGRDHHIVVRDRMTATDVLSQIFPGLARRIGDLLALQRAADEHEELGTALLAWKLATGRSADSAPGSTADSTGWRTPLAAARRLLQHAAGSCDHDTVTGPLTDEVWRRYALLIEIDPGLPLSRHAAAYLDAREEIRRYLARSQRDFGLAALPSDDAADRLSMSPGMWRLFVERGLAPGPDLRQPDRWITCTLTAWRLRTGRPV